MMNPIKHYTEPIDIIIPCRSKIRKWAFENAYMLAVVFFFFIVTWVAIFILGVKVYAE